jgi:ComEC/Rec2-related protein
VLVPSLFIFLTSVASIILTYSNVLDGSGAGLGSAIALLAALSFWPVFRSSIMAETEPPRCRRRDCLMKTAFLVVIAAALAFFFFTRIRRFGRTAPSLPRASYMGEVIRAKERRYDREALIHFRVDGGRAGGPVVWRNGTAYVYDAPLLRPGDLIRFHGRPVPVALCGLPSEFRRRSICRGSDYIIFPDGIAVIPVGSGISLRDRIRGWLSARIDSTFGKNTSSVVKALYFGNQSYIDKRTLNDFKRAGVLHVLAASGLHVGMIAGIVLLLLGLFRMNRKLMLASAAIVIASYLYITDMPVSLLRAGIMFVVYALQKMADREVNVVNTLFLSGIIILAVHPYEIYSLGFQLSFGATLGILLFYRSYRRSLNLLPRFLSSSLALTLSAQTIALPVQLAGVGEISLAGILSNIIVVPGIFILLASSAAALALSSITGYAAHLGTLVDTFFKAIASTVGFVSGLPCYFGVTESSPLLLAAFGMLLLPLLPRLSRASFAPVFVAGAFAVAWFSLALPPPPRRMQRMFRHDRGTVLLVKEGDSLSVIGALPDKKTRERVEEEIARASFRDVSLYITHPDYTSIAGYSYLARRYPVRSCYLSERFHIGRQIKRFLRILDRDGVPLIIHDFSSCQSTPLTSSIGADSIPLHGAPCALYRLMMETR